MAWLPVGIMLVMLVFLLFVYSRRETMPYAKNIVICSFFIVIGLCFFLLKEAGIIGNKNAAIIENEIKYRTATAHALAKTVLSKHKSGDVIIFTRLTGNDDQFVAASIETITNGFKGSGLNVVVKALKPAMKPSQDMYEEDAYITVDNYKTLLDEKGEYVAVISLLDMPYDGNTDGLWKSLSSKFDIYFLSGDVDLAARAIVAGHIDAVIAWKPGVKFSRDTASSDLDAAFNKRYVVVDAKNIKEFASPEAFKPPVVVKKAVVKPETEPTKPPALPVNQ